MNIKTLYLPQKYRSASDIPLKRKVEDIHLPTDRSLKFIFLVSVLLPTTIAFSHAILTTHTAYALPSQKGGGGGGGVGRTGGSTLQIQVNFGPPNLDHNNLQFMGAGHFMGTRGVLYTNGQIGAVTRIQTITALGGFHGSAVLIYEDKDGNVIGQSARHRYGVDGTAIGTSDRTEYWNENVAADLAPRIAKIDTFHIWDPQYNAFQNIFNKAAQNLEPAIQFYQELKNAGIVK